MPAGSRALQAAVLLPQPGWAHELHSKSSVQPGIPVLNIGSLCKGTAEKTESSRKDIKISSLLVDLDIIFRACHLKLLTSWSSHRVCSKSPLLDS